MKKTLITHCNTTKIKKQQKKTAQCLCGWSPRIQKRHGQLSKNTIAEKKEQAKACTKEKMKKSKRKKGQALC